MDTGLFSKSGNSSVRTIGRNYNPKTLGSHHFTPKTIGSHSSHSGGSELNPKIQKKIEEVQARYNSTDYKY
jgi:hypothetical protein